MNAAFFFLSHLVIGVVLLLQRPMDISEKRDALLKELSAIRNSQERFAFVIAKGRNAIPLQEEFKTDANRVEGCLAKLWFHAEMREGRCLFQTDSDSAIVKGISSLLCGFYSGHTPAEVISVEPTFLEKAGISQHLTPNRRNSLSRIWEKIRAFAEIHLYTK